MRDDRALPNGLTEEPIFLGQGAVVALVVVARVEELVGLVQQLGIPPTGGQRLPQILHDVRRTRSRHLEQNDRRVQWAVGDAPGFSNQVALRLAPIKSGTEPRGA
mgnify:CR=1 FL=1